MSFDHLVLDYNGTLACDGSLLPGIEAKLNVIANDLAVHIITADTFGKCRQQCQDIKGEVIVLKNPVGAVEKQDFVHSLGSERVVAIGNGTNDKLMLAQAALGIAVMGSEGMSAEAMFNADIIVSSIHDALDLLINTDRLAATLRQ
ncbi:MAG: ATPase P [Bacillota bacterium]